MGTIERKETVTQHETCERCRTAYTYPMEIEVSHDYEEDDPADRASVEALVDEEFREEVEYTGLIVPCPACGALTSSMRKQHRGELGSHILGLLAVAFLTCLLALIPAMFGDWLFFIPALGLILMLFIVWQIALWFFGGDKKKIGTPVDHDAEFGIVTDS